MIDVLLQTVERIVSSADTNKPMGKSLKRQGTIETLKFIKICDDLGVKYPQNPSPLIAHHGPSTEKSVPLPSRQSLSQSLDGMGRTPVNRRDGYVAQH
jgi:hypothetical protein